MDTSTIFIHNPTAPVRDMKHAKARRLDGLGGRKIGFLWNSKPNGDTLFNRIEELLRQKYEISSTMHARKPHASIPAEVQVYDELAASVDGVILGLGD